MACSNRSAIEDEDDCDVIFEGSPLHEHLQRFGLNDDENVESRNVEKQQKQKSDLVEKRKSEGIRKSSKKASNQQG